MKRKEIAIPWVGGQKQELSPMVEAFHRLAGIFQETEIDPFVPFLHSNEIYTGLNPLETISILWPNPGQKLHIGVSGLQNLDMIAARRSDFGVFIDINPNIPKVVDIVRNIFKRSPNIEREGFLTALIDELDKEVSLWGNEAEKKQFQINNFKLKASERFSWLAAAESFDHIKKMFQGGRIICVGMDFGNYGQLQKIIQWADLHKVTVDSVYISNIFEWNMGGNREKLKSLAMIVQPSTIILSSYGTAGELSAFQAQDHPDYEIDFGTERQARFSGSFMKEKGPLSTDP